MNKKKTLIICLIILGVAAVATFIIFTSEPEAERSGATKQTDMLVDVVRVEGGSFSPEIVVTGSVRPSKEVWLSPRVSGEILSISESFEPGGYVKKGEMLYRIDPADYRNALELRLSDLRQAEAELEIEQGRQKVARKDLELVEDIVPEGDNDLVLREPQLNSVQARLKAARASVNQARLALERTTVRAPFDAHILSRSVNEGSQVAPGDNTGRLVGMDTYWVIVNIPVSKLRWLNFPDSPGEQGSPVKIRNRNAWPEGVYRTGYLHKLVGSLDGQTRLAQAIISVPDPTAYNKDSEVPGLMINGFVEARIQATEVENVVRLNRDYLREDETVWVMKDGKLQIRETEVLLTDATYAYISEGLSEDDRVVATNLTTVTEGAGLRVAEGTDSTMRADSTQRASKKENEDRQQEEG
ncbi:efflux RND transporter periplasmic adaptor subunit [Roseivirga sp. BDSF3-8]|uniref:efflux RND transporter periplasmic adaptor subunit n=1 Tax=Roseivirga sp. BDSF3-8 TaxID=3241598 RepID=UPI00353207A1